MALGRQSGRSASLEWDFYGGYKWSLPADFVADFGALYYWYPGTYPSGFTNPDTTELYAALNWKMLQVKYSYSVNNTFGFSDSSGSYYVEGNVNWDVIEKVNDIIGKVTLIGHVGYQSYKNWGDYSYTDWKVGASTEVWGVTVGIFGTGTDAKARCTQTGLARTSPPTSSSASFKRRSDSRLARGIAPRQRKREVHVAGRPSHKPCLYTVFTTNRVDLTQY